MHFVILCRTGHGAKDCRPETDCSADAHVHAVPMPLANSYVTAMQVAALTDDQCEQQKSSNACLQSHQHTLMQRLMFIMKPPMSSKQHLSSSSI